MRTFLLSIVAIFGTTAILQPIWGSNQVQAEQWLEERISEAKSIGRGSSQASLLRVFTVDAGDHPAPYRYLLKSCQLISADVSFGNFGTPDPHRPNEDIKGPNVVSVSALYLENPTRPKQFSEQEKWLLPLMNDCYSIKPEMSRATLLKTFVPEAGLQPMLPTRYVHKKCGLVKIDVTFNTDGKIKPPKHRIASDEDLEIKTVSKPYVDLAICD
jgi:hypothetical protein